MPKSRQPFRDVITATRRYAPEDPVAFRQRKIREAFAALGPVVYFMRVGNFIKIGTSTNLKSRFRTHGERGAWGQLEDILAVIPGSYDVERQMLDRFAASLAKGDEWFHPTADLIEYINELRRKAGIDLVR